MVLLWSVRSAAADKGHLRCHNRQELDVGVERMVRHLEQGVADMAQVHQQLDRDGLAEEIATLSSLAPMPAWWLSLQATYCDEQHA